MGYLHEKPRDECLSDVDVILFRRKFYTSSWKSEAIHNPRELLSNVISTKKYIYEKCVPKYAEEVCPEFSTSSMIGN